MKKQTLYSTLSLIAVLVLAPQFASAQNSLLTGAFGFQATGFGPQNGSQSPIFIPIFPCGGVGPVADGRAETQDFCGEGLTPRAIGAGGTFLFAAAGLMVFDGAGHIIVTDTVSVNGAITRFETYTGTYTVSSNGTGSMTLHSGIRGTPVHLEFVIVSNGTQIQLVGADDGIALTGTAIRQ